jgi:hypothetical protein
MVNIIDSVTVCTLSNRPILATTIYVKSNQKDFESIATQIIEINKFMPCQIYASTKTNVLSFEFMVRNENYESESTGIIFRYVCKIDDDDFNATYKNLLSYLMITKNDYVDDIFNSISDVPSISIDETSVDFSVKCGMIIFDKMNPISGHGKSSNVFSIKG